MTHSGERLLNAMKRQNWSSEFLGWEWFWSLGEGWTGRGRSGGFTVAYPRRTCSASTEVLRIMKPKCRFWAPINKTLPNSVPESFHSILTTPSWGGGFFPASTEEQTESQGCYIIFPRSGSWLQSLKLNPHMSNSKDGRNKNCKTRTKAPATISWTVLHMASKISSRLITLASRSLAET